MYIYFQYNLHPFGDRENFKQKTINIALEKGVEVKLENK